MKISSWGISRELSHTRVAGGTTERLLHMSYKGLTLTSMLSFDIEVEFYINVLHLYLSQIAHFHQRT